ncbi:MAG: class C sortase [Flaviflexus sp.]|uniref:class C sortase n=1 Tax=Flaviflexus sp. TaxID=1969482 RepID=UPI003F8DEDA6
MYEADANVATGSGKHSEGSLVYEGLLNLTGAGLMGRLQYEELAIDLPIYHGTADQTLQRGVGHLKGTSLPVGGAGTRSVLTAHRGLPEATLFNDLDQAQTGDTFSVVVLNEVITYQVVDVQVIDPDQTEAIIADPDRDLITLVTCTPLGINSHRILVTGERITPTPVEDVKVANESHQLPGFPWWAVILCVTVIALGTYIWRSGYGRATKPMSTPPPQ